ncbi:uncharacterized protein J7T54_000820 [Emericellopsis cladophorae]|uniref:Uncharacterized protein n=1 Tax=Emericellopsis cladophorae TaxID=2686198 RepID=A0A9Q0BEQ3_9HYPO|nr:uncharacterized protein J7T54_000820 [Emericellopsis cladophorae]KAI6782677.1 hypothetical protein J7T54_000820 [Emericellopsis cladophorae]
MGPGRKPLELRPNALYIILFLKQEQLTRPRSFTGSTQFSTNDDDRFEWGLYWCKSPESAASPGVGFSTRYREKDGLWTFEHTLFPSLGKESRISIESDPRVVLALHIENMYWSMASLLEESLCPKNFFHSQPSRDISCGRTEAIAGIGYLDVVMPSRDRVWLGHALLLLNDRGFISLREESSVIMVKREALSRAKANMAPWGPRKSVETSEHVHYDTHGEDVRTRIQLSLDESAPTRPSNDRQELPR